MRLKVLAFDFDGTLTLDDSLPAETRLALEEARGAGHLLLLVTGRILDELPGDLRQGGPFGAIVAENGAVVYFPTRQAVALPFGRVSAAVVQALVERRIPLDLGLSLVATRVPHDQVVEAVLREAGGGAVMEYNKGAVMVLPPGASKGSGLHYALGELGYSLHNTLACGDAENDRSMFTMSEVSVAVANASPSLREVADLVLAQANGEGVRGLIASLLAGGLEPGLPPRPERQLPLGSGEDGSAVGINASDLLRGNLAVLGASRSGKSWLAGLLLEHLTGLGYQTCVIDPEGDYRTLRSLPHVLVLGGHEGQLPDVPAVLTIMEYAGVSLVLDFSLYGVPARDAYVTELLRALRALRAARGRPHWLLLDEVQNLCLRNSTLTHEVLGVMQDGGVAFLAYRPAQLPAELLRGVGHWLLTTLRLPEDLEALGPLLGAQGHDAAGITRMLPLLTRGEGLLCSAPTRTGQPPRSVRFRAAARVSTHVRHLHKYLLAPLPGEKRFYFRDERGATYGQAASLWEFREALHTIPVGSLSFHLARGDFESWLGTVVCDAELATQTRKLAHAGLSGEALRAQFEQVVQDRYAELERLT